MCSDDVQIEDVFDDEPVRFSVKENFASVVQQEVKQEFPPILMSSDQPLILAHSDDEFSDDVKSSVDIAVRIP